MSQPPMPRASLRGAVDLSSLGNRPATPAGTPAAGSPHDGLRVDITEATFENCVMGTREVPALIVLWSSTNPDTEQAVTAAVEVAASCNRGLRVLALDVDTYPQVAAAFKAQQVPTTMAMIAGQLMPLFAGVQQADALLPVAQEILSVAASNGVQGTVPAAPEQSSEPAGPSPYAEAEAAIARGDREAARTAYTAVLAGNPDDAGALSGIARVELLERVEGVDLATARAKAADGDIASHLVVADVDVVGGHVEDAFTRLLDLVRSSAGADRDSARTRLLTLFDVVGPQDERVIAARRALMSALF